MIHRAATVISIWAMALSLGPHAYGQESCGPGTDPDDAASRIEVCVVDRPRYAVELFGAGADALELSYMDEPDPDDPDAAAFSNRPKVLLELPDRRSGARDDIVTVIFPLNGAVFAERIRISDLKVRNLGDGGGVGVRVRVEGRRRDGRAGRGVRH